MVKAEDLAMNDGYDAAESGLPRNANPYSPLYFLHKWWDLGWLEFVPM